MSAEAYADYILSLGPVAYWKCDETSGTALVDSGPNGLDATLAGTLSNVTTGIEQFDSAIDWDGSTNIATVDGADHKGFFNFLVNAQIFTVVFWAKWDDYETDVRNGIMGNAMDGVDSGWSIVADDRSGQGLSNAMTWVSSSGGWVIKAFNSDIPDANLHCYILSGDGTNLKLYRDDASVGTTTVQKYEVLLNDSLNFGGVEDNGTTHWFDGLLFQISIHQRELTAAERTAIYNLGTNARTVAGNLAVNGSPVQTAVRMIDTTDGRVVGSGVGDGSGNYSVDVSTENEVYVVEFDDYGAEWLASTAYVLNDIVHPTTGNGFYYECTTAGTSNSTEPTWPTSGTVADNTVTWTAHEFQRPRIHGPIEVV